MTRYGPSPSKTPPEPSPLARHDHEWRLADVGPFIEDGAVIFHEECQWAEVTGSATSKRHDETFYEYGAECDETRSYRFELAWLERRLNDAPNVFYLGNELDRFMEQASIEAGLIAVEENGEIETIDPDPDYGYVVVSTDDWRAKYKADTTPQINPKPRY